MLTYAKLIERTSQLIEKINESGLKSVLKEKDDLRATIYKVEAK